ncbi:hypothetical protein PHYSODRAFT_304471 [Phytophthora sojae]|uniref:Uncharacterized protein n=1 Tax=Phytophthora sojae (strain P6497) TaxID=1094619 RepID=G5A170_PHYSP|nr:hypothetical protein PHYSODRAFT_304471 [Phytophthora sojae]EGZ10671.1 hypothetical protein PHYSODRAFT_304471 [Phytophthora sojae]|eukprot:XP_009533416.1 hypothetical protein PHYSODRAFT_304471 [Phytophthora sojae]
MVENVPPPASLPAIVPTSLAQIEQLKNIFFFLQTFNVDTAKLVAAQNDTIEALNGKIKAQDGKIKAQDGKIKALDDRIKVHNDEIKAIRDKISAQDGKITALERQIARLQPEVKSQSTATYHRSAKCEDRGTEDNTGKYSQGQRSSALSLANKELIPSKLM